MPGEENGRIYRLFRDEKKIWTKDAAIHLTGIPFVGTADSDDRLVVATRTQLTRITYDSRRVEVIFKPPFWAELLPHSMVVTPEGKIFLGMRHGIARFDKQGSNYSASWLVPNKAIAEQEYKPRVFK